MTGAGRVNGTGVQPARLPLSIDNDYGRLECQGLAAQRWLLKAASPDCPNRSWLAAL